MSKLDVDAVLTWMMGMPGTMPGSMQKTLSSTSLRAARRHGIEVPATKKLLAAVEKRAVGERG